MFNLIKNNLKLKILIPIVAIFLIIGSVIYIIATNSIKTTLQDEFISKGKALINTMASSVQDTILNRDSSTVQSYIDQYRNVEGISFIIILDENNEIIAHTFYPKVPDEYIRLAGNIKPQVREYKDYLTIREEVLNERRELVLARPILNGLLGRIYVGMGIEKRETEIISPLFKRIMLVMGICTILMVVLVNIFLGYILRPIHELTKTASRYANGDSDIKRIPIYSDDAVGSLTETFYFMIDTITRNTKWLEQEVEKRTEIIKEQQISLINASKMSALGEMAGGVAHEINNPLAIISMKIAQIKDRVEEDKISKEEMIKGLMMIKSTSDRIAKIVSGLRFFAKDGTKTKMEKVSVASVVEDTFSFCMERMKLQGIEVRVKKESSDLFIDCRPVEISQVLLNLLNNASDAIEDKEVKWIEVAFRDDGLNVEISVTDSGDGVDKTIKDKIMEPFFTTKEVGKGTGLGLSISRGIIEAHRGVIFLDDKDPNTKFVIVLPKNA